MTAISLRSLWEGIASAGRADFLVRPDERMSYADLAHAVRRWLRSFDEARPVRLILDEDGPVRRSLDEAGSPKSLLFWNTRSIARSR